MLRFLGVSSVPLRKKTHKACAPEPPLGDEVMYVLNEDSEFVLRSSDDAEGEEERESE